MPTALSGGTFAAAPFSPASSTGLVVRLSVSPRCQLRCTYCLPAKGCACPPAAAPRELSRAELVRLLALLHENRGVRRVRFTGGDSGGRETVCGFIAPTTQPFCDGCQRLRLTSDGGLHGCLVRPSRHDLAPLLASDRTTAHRRLDDMLAVAFAQKQGARSSPASPPWPPSAAKRFSRHETNRPRHLHQHPQRP